MGQSKEQSMQYISRNEYTNSIWAIIKMPFRYLLLYNIKVINLQKKDLLLTMARLVDIHSLAHKEQSWCGFLLVYSVDEGQHTHHPKHYLESIRNIILVDTSEMFDYYRNIIISRVHFAFQTVQFKCIQSSAVCIWCLVRFLAVTTHFHIFRFDRYM